MFAFWEGNEDSEYLRPWQAEKPVPYLPLPDTHVALPVTTNEISAAMRIVVKSLSLTPKCMTAASGMGEKAP